MAYKFQIGASTLSGSVTLKESATFSSGFSNNDQNISNVGDIAVDSISADANDMSISLTDNRASSLDITQGGNSYMKFDTQNSAEVIIASKKLRMADDVSLTFGAADDAAIEYDEDGTDQLRIHAPAAGVVIAGTTPTLVIGDAGAEDTKIVFDGNAQDFHIGLDDSADELVIGLGSTVGSNTFMKFDENGNATLAGNLTVQGETTSIDSTTVNVSSSFTFEGPADAHETTLHAGGDGTGASPQADTSLYLPALTAGNYYIPALADQASQASAAVTAAEFALLDGGSSVGTTALASGDGFLHNDGGTMKQTSIDKIADFFAGDALEASSGVLAVAVDNSSIEINSDAIRVKASGITNAMLAGSIADSKLNTISTAGKVDLAALEIDGGTDIGEALVDADLIIVDNGAGGTNRKCAMSRIKTYIGAGTLSVASGSNSATLAVGMNYFNNHGGAISATCPASAGLSSGDQVIIKAGPDCSATNTLTIGRAGSQTFDGSLTSVVLESPNASITLVYVDTDDFRII